MQRNFAQAEKIESNDEDGNLDMAFGTFNFGIGDLLGCCGGTNKFSGIRFEEHTLFVKES